MGTLKGSLFVKVYTNQGIWGCGEGVDAIPGTYYLVKNFEARLKGKNPLNVHRLFEDIRKSGFFQGAQSGMYVAVLSAIETALMGYCRQGTQCAGLPVTGWKIPRQNKGVLRYGFVPAQFAHTAGFC